jgi:hypothetical protein
VDIDLSTSKDILTCLIQFCLLLIVTNFLPTYLPSWFQIMVLGMIFICITFHLFVIYVGTILFLRREDLIKYLDFVNEKSILSLTEAITENDGNQIR